MSPYRSTLLKMYLHTDWVISKKTHIQWIRKLIVVSSENLSSSPHYSRRSGPSCYVMLSRAGLNLLCVHMVCSVSISGIIGQPFLELNPSRKHKYHCFLQLHIRFIKLFKEMRIFVHYLFCPCDVTSSSQTAQLQLFLLSSLLPSHESRCASSLACTC